MTRLLTLLAAPCLAQEFSETAKKTTPAIETLNNGKVYDLITKNTTMNSEGNTLQLQLAQIDSTEVQGGRELHGRLTLRTERLPSSQEMSFGFAFAEYGKRDLFDGLQVTTYLDSARNNTFVPVDIASWQRPNIFSDVDTFIVDETPDWDIR